MMSPSTQGHDSCGRNSDIYRIISISLDMSNNYVEALEGLMIALHVLSMEYPRSACNTGILA